MRTDPREVAGRSFDLLVIGGGIQGAAIAREAALRGRSTLLVDGGDFAGGASSAGSGRIGGRTAGLERELLLRLAPHLVRPLPLLRPVRGGARPSVRAVRGSTLPAPEWHAPAACARLVPGLRGDGLSGGLLHYEAATHGGRLTIALLAAAAELGARACNHVEAVGVRGEAVRLLDHLAGGEIEVRPRHVANAAGADVDAVRRLLGCAGEQRARVAEVAHRLFDALGGEVGLAVGEAGAEWCAVPHPEALVWGPLEDAGGHPAPELASWLEEPPRERATRAARWAFPAAPSEDATVVEERSPVGPVLSVAGARLATHRAVAEEVLRRMGATGPSPARTQPLPGGGGPREVADPLWWRHGSRAWSVRELARGRPALLEPICPHRSPVGAEVLYAVRAQGAATLDDVARRVSDERGPCAEAGCTDRLHELYAEACEDHG